MELKDSKKNRNILKRPIGEGFTPEQRAKGNLTRLKADRLLQTIDIQGVAEGYLNGEYGMDEAQRFSEETNNFWNGKA